MKITVIGCGRWGSFHAWHAEKIGHEVTLYGRESSENFKRLKDTRTNEYLSLSEKIFLTNSLADAVDSADVVIISVGAQDLRGFVREMKNVCGNLKPKKFVLCMKGLESGTGKRLTTVFNEVMNNIPTAENPTVLRDGITNEPVKLTSIFSPTSESTNSVSGMIPLTGENLRPALRLTETPKNLQVSSNVAVWVGPGHVQDFVKGIPNCMVMSSADEKLTKEFVEIFKSPLIRFYYGADLLGTEIGAAAKNVIGIAAGMLDGLNRTSLKGALMARGTAELSRLVAALGGDKMTVYGLSHLGDYQATLFSPHSHNRKFGEDFILGKKFDKLAEGVETVSALIRLSDQTGVELPISRAVFEILHEGQDPKEKLTELFLRSTKSE